MGNQEQIPVALANLGDLEAQLFRPAEAVRDYNDALAAAREQQNDLYACEILRGLTGVHLDLADLVSAQTHGQESMEIAKRLGMEEAAEQAQGLLARIGFLRGDREEAVDWANAPAAAGAAAYSPLAQMFILLARARILLAAAHQEGSRHACGKIRKLAAASGLKRWQWLGAAWEGRTLPIGMPERTALEGEAEGHLQFLADHLPEDVDREEFLSRARASIAGG